MPNRIAPDPFTLRKKQKQWEWTTNALTERLLTNLVPECEGTISEQCVRNELYIVNLTRFRDGTVRLSIYDPTRRHDWQHYQRIKNELLGDDWEAVELYPRASCVVDAGNLYHLWCSPKPLGIGWDRGGLLTAQGTFYEPLPATKQLMPKKPQEVIAGVEQMAV